MKAFATFIFLSSVKILGVCFILLLSSRSYYSTGKKIHPGFLASDASIEYFSTEHLPFCTACTIYGFHICIYTFYPFNYISMSCLPEMSQLLWLEVFGTSYVYGCFPRQL